MLQRSFKFDSQTLRYGQGVVSGSRSTPFMVSFSQYKTCPKWCPGRRGSAAHANGSRLRKPAETRSPRAISWQRRKLYRRFVSLDLAMNSSRQAIKWTIKRLLIHIFRFCAMNLKLNILFERHVHHVQIPQGASAVAFPVCALPRGRSGRGITCRSASASHGERSRAVINSLLF